MWTRNFWKQTAERAIKSAAQALILLWTADAGFNIISVDVPETAGLAGGAAILSVLTSIVTATVGEPNDPSAVRKDPGLMLTRTVTRTHNATLFADPYKKCRQCGKWIDGALDVPGPLVLVPCEHRSDYRDVCPSWGPVDGCRCAEAGIVHDMRPPDPGDGKVY